MMPTITDTQKADILSRHIATRINFERRIAHKINGVMGSYLVVHSPERIPECKFCQALGIPEIKK